MKTVHVVAAVIKSDNKIFATQRGYGEYKDGWEFPGGKVEPGEASEEALSREIREELDVEIKVGDLLVTVEHDYEDFHLSMDCFWCEIVSGELALLEHEAARWLTLEEIWDVDWLPADVKVVEEIVRKNGMIYTEIG